MRVLPEGTQPVPASSTVLATALPAKRGALAIWAPGEQHVPVACVVLNRWSASASKPQQHRAGHREKSTAMYLIQSGAGLFSCD